MYKVFYEDSKGIELLDFLQDVENQRKLRGYRTFYIIKAKMESVPTYKIGITTNDGDGFYNRAMSYIQHYGYSQSSKSKCIGVKVYFILGVKYNKNVEPKNSFVARLELKLKNKLRQFTTPERGSERFKMSLQNLMEEVYEALPQVKETVTETRRSARLIKIKI